MKPKEPAALLQENRAVLKDHPVKALYLFGCVVRGEDKPRSDVIIWDTVQVDLPPLPVLLKKILEENLE